MGNDVLDPEMALRLFQILLYCMAYIFGGAALIALSVYFVLVGSEMLLEPRSKPKRAKAPQPTQLVRVAEETLDPSTATPILSVPHTLEEAGVPVNDSPRRPQIPITAPAALEAEPSRSLLTSVFLGEIQSERVDVHCRHDGRDDSFPQSPPPRDHIRVGRRV
jgi:hypothetical protein